MEGGYVMNTVFSEHIKELRIERNMNQADFSKLICTNQSTLSAYENGDRFPPYETLVCIAQQCHVSLDWLCGLNNKKSNSNEITTYSDLISILMQLKDTQNISVDFSLKSRPESHFLSSSIEVMICEIDDKHIVDFYQEWNDILSFCKKTPTGNKLYDIWLKDVLERFKFPLENAKQIIEESPFT